MAQLANRPCQTESATGDSKREVLPDHSRLPEEGTMADHDHQELPGSGFWSRPCNVSPFASDEEIEAEWARIVAYLDDPRFDCGGLPGKRGGGCG